LELFHWSFFLKLPEKSVPGHGDVQYVYIYIYNTYSVCPVCMSVMSWPDVASVYYARLLNTLFSVEYVRHSSTVCLCVNYLGRHLVHIRDQLYRIIGLSLISEPVISD
jgi:hypothetical protein